MLVPSLERAVHAVALFLEPSLRGLGITQAEAHVLGHLARHGDSSINDIHEGFGHKRSTLTSILDRLESRGLVERAPHPTSRRSIMIHLTPSGRATASAVVEMLQTFQADVAGQVSPHDLEGFARVIEAIASKRWDGS